MELTQEFPTGPILDYQQNARPESIAGDILMCSGSGAFSRMIQLGTKSDWSHIASIHWVEFGVGSEPRLMVMESVEGHGVRMVPLSSYLSDYASSGKPYPGGLAIARHVDMTPEAAAAGTKWAIPRLGYEYDKGEIVTIAWRVMSGISGDVDTDNQFICSEFKGRMLKAGGLEVYWNKQGFLAPSDYANDPKIELLGVLQAKPD